MNLVIAFKAQKPVSGQSSALGNTFFLSQYIVFSEKWDPRPRIHVADSAHSKVVLVYHRSNGLRWLIELRRQLLSLLWRRYGEPVIGVLTDDTYVPLFTNLSSHILLMSAH